jgi:hypothetical protein
MPNIDEILQLLKDGEWHSTQEIAQKTALPEHKIKTAFEFLSEYNFVQLNENSAKLNAAIIAFFEEIQRLENEEN